MILKLRNQLQLDSHPNVIHTLQALQLLKCQIPPSPRSRLVHWRAGVISHSETTDHTNKNDPCTSGPGSKGAIQRSSHIEEGLALVWGKHLPYSPLRLQNNYQKIKLNSHIFLLFVSQNQAIGRVNNHHQCIHSKTHNKNAYFELGAGNEHI